jgi:NADH-quinone oxidoreductase subunit L
LPVAVIGAGSVGLAAGVAALVGAEFLAGGSTPKVLELWTWLDVGGFEASVRLYLDGLSLVMTGVITGVGFLIHVYATGYMAGERGYSRFFAYMNLFVFAMLMLVLGDNLLVLVLGWEGVGLCSYLLIGFFHDDAANGYAARKAFVVTRVGDTFMAIGLFLLYRELGTLDIQTSLEAAPVTWPDGSATCTAIALLLLGGAAGKSAQVPLQTWLPDAMAGPTPVSALIHAATMVTAGVYVIARMHDVFLLSPLALSAVAVVGLVTLVIASFTALVQHDIKRVLAYSTMSQIGYMFLALGVGAWSAAIFHLMTHAFFKALLFLAAGSVILSLHHEQDMRRMGGLWRRLKLPFWSMAIGSAALAALPLTSGFYSKDLILLGAFSAPGGMWLWGFGAFAAFLTTLYTMRMMRLTFFGDLKTEPHEHRGLSLSLPLALLAALAVGGGWFGLAPVASVLPDGGVDAVTHQGAIVWLTALVPIAGLAVGWLLWFTSAGDAIQLEATAFGRSLASIWRSGFGFDVLYDVLVVRPFTGFARVNRADGVDLAYRLAAALTRGVHYLVALGQTATWCSAAWVSCQIYCSNGKRRVRRSAGAAKTARRCSDAASR